MIILMDRGISTKDLLCSNVFYYTFEHEEWPAVHSNLSKITAPYNGSIFKLRDNYKSIYPDLLTEEESAAAEETAKVSKN